MFLCLPADFLSPLRPPSPPLSAIAHSNSCSISNATSVNLVLNAVRNDRDETRPTHTQIKRTSRPSASVLLISTHLPRHRQAHAHRPTLRHRDRYHGERQLSKSQTATDPAGLIGSASKLDFQSRFLQVNQAWRRAGLYPLAATLRDSSRLCDSDTRGPSPRIA